MSKILQVGNDIFEYPQQGTGQGHGEDATAWAEAVTAALADFLGPNDILLTTQSIANGAVNQVISELSFNVGQVQHTNVEFLIIRNYLDGGVTSTNAVESGKIYGNYTGVDFRINIESVGDDTGVEIDVNASGQFQYSSTTQTTGGDAYVSSLLYFKAKTIDQ